VPTVLEEGADGVTVLADYGGKAFHSDRAPAGAPGAPVEHSQAYKDALAFEEANYADERESLGVTSAEDAAKEQAELAEFRAFRSRFAADQSAPAPAADAVPGGLREAGTAGPEGPGTVPAQ
jgi:hypothetical protein